MGMVVCTEPRYQGAAVDLDTITQSGCYYCPNSSENLPNEGSGGSLYVGGGSSSVAVQVFAQNSSSKGQIYTRRRNSSGWSDWAQQTW